MAYRIERCGGVDRVRSARLRLTGAVEVTFCRWFLLSVSYPSDLGPNHFGCCLCLWFESRFAKGMMNEGVVIVTFPFSPRTFSWSFFFLSHFRRLS